MKTNRDTETDAPKDVRFCVISFTPHSVIVIMPICVP